MPESKMKDVATAYPLFYRSYSRRAADGSRETWAEVCDRTVAGLKKLGDLTDDEADLLYRMQRERKAMPSGRWLWVGGTEWVEKPENFYGAYNCSSTVVTDWRAFGLMMNLAMTGCGTGAVLEPKYTDQLPSIRNELRVRVIGTPGNMAPEDRLEHTLVTDLSAKRTVEIIVGDSRQGWVKAYQTLLELSSDETYTGPINVVVYVSNVRPAGSKLSGFGGTANPVKLPGLFTRCAEILNDAIGRRLTPVECCLLIDEAALVVVAGNIRRSAGMKQFSSADIEAATAKDNLWQQGEDGSWAIDPKKDALRMSNHTRVFHEQPDYETVLESVSKQFFSGEGAIQWAGEAKKRAQGGDRYGLNPCGK